jgi:ATP-dependent Clp protease adaptor protein ClpS
MAERDSGTAIGNDVEERVEEELKVPPMFNVVMYNDHYTTMEFVVSVLRTIFHKPIIEATKIMMDVHKRGKAIVGTYTYDVAVTKVAQVLQKAREYEYPLKCTVENA